MKKLAAIVLAAGRGTRLNSKVINKVMLPLCGKPMIGYTFELLRKVGISPIIVVVGFKKESVMNYLKDKVLYAFQKKRLGTAHAVSSALAVLPPEIEDVLIVNGDDSYIYPAALIKQLILTHKRSNASLTLLTIEKEDPTGLGRILRNSKGEVLGIVEHKEATAKQRQIREVNPQCWVFRVSFLKKFLPKVKKSQVSGEYYLTELVKLATEAGERIEAVATGRIPWRGVNTKEELEEARRLISQFTKVKS